MNKRRDRFTWQDGDIEIHPPANNEGEGRARARQDQRSKEKQSDLPEIEDAARPQRRDYDFRS